MIQVKSSSQKIGIFELILVEVVIAVIIYLLGMTSAYFYLGADGVGEIVDSMNGQFKLSSLVPAGINFIIGIFLWLFFKKYNFKKNNNEYKRILRLVSEGLLDTFIVIFRLAGGVLISFAILYLFVEHYEHILLVYISYGLISLFNSSFLMFFKHRMFLRPDRELKRTSY